MLNEKWKMCSLRRTRWNLIYWLSLRAVGFHLFARLNDRRVFLFLQRAEVFSELAIPRWNYYRNRAVGLRLTGEANQRFRFGRVDVTEFFDLFSFARADVREFSGAAQHAYPASAARRRTTLDGNRSFTAAWIDRAPVARMI